ncbi:MAG TPA: hypothetical protein VMR45_00645 [Patescibacteria group bacterium]|nr:hypothetical protein [Patescibacteria group bacterium]
MELDRPASAARQIFHCFMPSPASAVGCFLASLGLVMLHVLYASITSRNYLPTFLGGNWAVNQFNGMFGWIEEFTGSEAVSGILQVLLWSLIGLVIFGVIEFCVKGYLTWRKASREVSFVGEGQVAPHPLSRNVLLVVLWRLFIGGCAIIFALTAWPLLRWVLSTDTTLLTGLPFSTSLWRFLLAILAWVFLLHCCVVLLRLYTLRTRLFGGEFY